MSFKKLLTSCRIYCRSYVFLSGYIDNTFFTFHEKPLTRLELRIYRCNLQRKIKFAKFSRMVSSLLKNQVEIFLRVISSHRPKWRDSLWSPDTKPENRLDLLICLMVDLLLNYYNVICKIENLTNIQYLLRVGY